MRQIDLDNERDYENRKASGEDLRARQSKFYWATAIPIERHNKRTCRAIKGARTLEIGCSSGADAMNYCTYAASYIGVDISDVAIDNCRALSLPNAEFHCVDGHRLPVDDASIDYVIVNSLLHHLDLELALKEISRVLVPAGSLIFREPLGTNPIFQLYRLATPTARTDDERPFNFNDIKLLGSYFSLAHNVQWFGFLSLISAFIKMAPIRILLTKCDDLLSCTPARFLFWQFSGIAQSKKN